MIERIRQYFDRHFPSPGLRSGSGDQTDHGYQVACAALLIEMTRADFEVDAVEREEVNTLVIRHFGLSEAEAAELTELAELEVRHATSLYQFTGLINSHFEADQKAHLIRMLWDVACADGRIDRYEDHLVRKIADLIHVPHSEFIRAKHEALAAR